jgi:hypothetical protein
MLLGRQIQLRIDGIEVLRAALTVGQPLDLDPAKDAQQLPPVPALDVAPTHPIGAHHPVKPPLADRAQIEVILQHHPDQLATILPKTRLQLGVLKAPRLLTRNPPAQRKELLGRAREPLGRARLHRPPQAALARDRCRVLARMGLSGRTLAHRRISLPRTGEPVEKIGGHATPPRSKSSTTPTFATRSAPPPNNPLESHPARSQPARTSP